MANLNRFLSSACVVLVVLAFAGCGRKETPHSADSGPALERVRMHLDWHPQTEYGGYYQAIARGFYREAGLEVEIVTGGPGVPFKETVAMRRADIGCTDGNDVIVAISRGVPLVIVAAEMQRNPQGILYHEEHPLADFRALQGRTFMAGPGSAWVEYLKRSQGIAFDLLPLTADLTSFLADKTMVRQCFVTQEPYFAQQKGARVGTLLIADSGYAPYRVIYTSREFLAQRPEVVRAFVAASVRGFDDLLDGDPAPAFAALQQANALMTPDVMAFSRDAMKSLRLVQGDPARGERTGQITRARIAHQIETLQSLGQLGKPLQVEDVAAFGFAP
jgi:NitT/TauT family transport system substrate-binding protein